MGDDVKTLGPLKDTAMSGHANFPPEDLQTMVKLYQKCPHRWEQFRDIAHVVELMTAKPEADLELLKGLCATEKHFDTNKPNEVDVIQFAALCGFVERGVSFARQMLRDMRMSYLTEFPPRKDADVPTLCLKCIRNQMLSCTADSPEFCVRLTKTGYLLDLVEDIKHTQHLTADALERSEVFLLAFGTIHNCCMYPESAAEVRQLAIAPYVMPFLTKRGKRHFVRATAMAVLANVLEEDNLDILVLDGELLQYFLDHILGALSTNKFHFAEWYMSEILFDLCLLARTDVNRRLIVAQGTLPVLRSVLDPSKKRSEEEKNNAVTLISRLMEDQVNLQICQNYPELVEVLKDLVRNGASDTVEKVRDVLGKLKCHKRGDLDDRIPAFPHVAQLLADQYNLPSILHMGLVEFVLDELKTFTGEQGKAAAHGDGASCQQVLLALTELADDQVYRREIMSRGGLAMLKTVLQTFGSEEKTEAAKAVLALTMASENRQIIKVNTDLMTLLEDAKEKEELPELADKLLAALH